MQGYRKDYYVDNKERIDRQNREYYLENKEDMDDYYRQWAEENKEHLSEYRRNWALENREQLNETRAVSTAKRRTFIRSLPFELTASDWTIIKGWFNFKCALSESEDVILEHFIPLSIGHGGTSIFNCYPLSASLNGSKYNYNPFEWAKEQIEKGIIELEMWDNLVSYLSNINGLSVSYFKEFVYWCFDNKREPEEILDDTSSIDIWLKKRGSLE